MDETPSPRAVQVTHDLIVVMSRLRRRLKELTGADDLSPPQRSVLQRLAKEGPASVTDLAGAERVRPQSMVATVAALEQAGLLVRTPDPRDGRRQTLSLTPLGRERHLSDRAARERWLAGLLADRCTAGQLDVLAEVLAMLDTAAGDA